MSLIVKHPYNVEAVSRAFDLLEAFHAPGETLRLRDLVARTGLNKATAFRLLQTLEQRGIIERCGTREYRSRVRFLKRGRYRFGYAALSFASLFAREMTQSLEQAAAKENVELLVLDNKYSAATALRNVDVFISQKVDLAIDFQIDESIAPTISSKFHEAGIPFIALGTPHPGATYYGIDNYHAGLCGGRYLGEWARKNIDGPVEEILLLDLSRIGALPRSRLAGVLQGIQEVLPAASTARVTRLEGDGLYGPSLEAVRKYLRVTPSRITLIGAINDPSAVGALRAFEEAGRAKRCAVLGHDASPAGRAELRRPNSRLIASVAFFAEKYGPAVLALALDMMEGRRVPPAIFAKHHLITRDNVNRYYPNDTLLSPDDIETQLLQWPSRGRKT